MDITLAKVVIPEKGVPQEGEHADEVSPHAVCDHIGLGGRHLLDCLVLIYSTPNLTPHNGGVYAEARRVAAIMDTPHEESCIIHQWLKPVPRIPGTPQPMHQHHRGPGDRD